MAKEIEPKLQTIGAYLKKSDIWHILGIHQIAISYGKMWKRI